MQQIERVYSVSCIACGEYSETDPGRPQPAHPTRCWLCRSSLIEVAEVAAPTLRRDTRLGNRGGFAGLVQPKPTLAQLERDWS
jgi:hypothetical protein